MPKELYIYSPLYDFTAETVVKQLNEVSESEELTVRLNTPGGNVAAGWAIISKMSERKTPINAIIDGDAASMGAMMLVFFDKVISNDTSTIMFHKAAYPKWYEPNEGELQKLKAINESFKSKLLKKVDGKPGAQEFIDKVFEADVRNDVELTPYKAKLLGIVNEVRTLEPKAYHGMQIVALNEAENTPKPEGEVINKNQIFESMDLNKLKTEHPALYAEVFGLGKVEGKAEEKIRVEAWTVFNEVDPEKVKAGIESGNVPNAKDYAEFNMKAISAKKIEAIEDENVEETDTKPEAKTKEQLQAEADQKVLDEEMGELKTY